MTFDEAKAIIDRAWNSGPKAIDWSEVEEASMVIVATTGAVYIPDNDEMGRWPGRVDPKAAAPSSRGTPNGYDAGSRRGGVRPAEPKYQSVRSSIPRDTSLWDLLDVDEKPVGYP